MPPKHGLGDPEKTLASQAESKRHKRNHSHGSTHKSKALNGPRDESKKSNQDSETPQNPDSASLRHLFTTDHISAAIPANASDASESIPQKQFSFFGGQDPLPEIANSEKEAADPRNESTTYEYAPAPARFRSHASRQEPERNYESEPRSDYASYQRDDHFRNRPNKNFDTRAEQGAQAQFKLSEGICFRPAELAELASKFCRSNTLEQLGEEWDAENGIRDEMRRDFKLRRQTSALETTADVKRTARF